MEPVSFPHNSLFLPATGDAGSKPTRNALGFDRSDGLGLGVQLQLTSNPLVTDEKEIDRARCRPNGPLLWQDTRNNYETTSN